MFSAIVIKYIDFCLTICIKLRILSNVNWAGATYGDDSAPFEDPLGHNLFGLQQNLLYDGFYLSNEVISLNMSLILPSSNWCTVKSKIYFNNVLHTRILHKFKLRMFVFTRWNY